MIATALGLVGIVLLIFAGIVSFVLDLAERRQRRPSQDPFDDLTDWESVGDFGGRSPASRGRAGALRAEPRAGSQAKPLIPNARGE